MMKKPSIIFIQIAIILICFAAIIGMIRLPLTEGRAKELDLFHIYAEPFILYGYLTALVFFVGMYQVFKILGYIRKNAFNSLKTIDSFKNFKYAAIVLGVLMIMAGIYIKLFHAKEDDPAGFLAICFATTLLSIVVVVIAVKQENKLLASQDALS